LTRGKRGLVPEFESVREKKTSGKEGKDTRDSRVRLEKKWRCKATNPTSATEDVKKTKTKNKKQNRIKKRKIYWERLSVYSGSIKKTITPNSTSPKRRIGNYAKRGPKNRHPTKKERLKGPGVSRRGSLKNENASEIR